MDDYKQETTKFTLEELVDDEGTWVVLATTHTEMGMLKVLQEGRHNYPLRDNLRILRRETKYTEVTRRIAKLLPLRGSRWEM